jgi:hypothetical protein
MTQWIDKSGGGNSTTSKTGTITMTPNGTTPSSSSLTTTSLNVYGTILAPNGNIYGVSAGSANQIYAIRFSGIIQTPSLAYCLSPFTNKPSN